ncbi:hypothetical protein [Bacillus sp. REN3]|nr:hypothetical protein [Bacillus sp. REN3]
MKNAQEPPGLSAEGGRLKPPPPAATPALGLPVRRSDWNGNQQAN